MVAVQENGTRTKKVSILIGTIKLEIFMQA